MKRLIASVLILILAVAFSLMGEQYIKHSLNDILSAIENNEAVAETWDSKKEMLSILLKHEDIDAVDEEIAAMKLYEKNGRTQEAEDCMIRAQSYIKGIMSGEKFSIGNIF